MAFACMTILVWDHIVTFGDEVCALQYGSVNDVTYSELYAGEIRLGREKRPM